MKTKEKARAQARLIIAIAMIPVVIFAPYFLGSLALRIADADIEMRNVGCSWLLGVIICGVVFLVLIAMIDFIVSIVEWITGDEIDWGRNG